MPFVAKQYQGEDVVRFVQEQMEEIEIALQLIEDGSMDIRNAAPDKPRNGLYYADGTDWNPGSGKGVYRYDEDTTSFVLLG